MTSQFGTLLRQLRRQVGMTQEQLAEQSGLGVRTIRRLETGEPTDPRLGTVKLLADALGIAPQERQNLLSEAGGATPPDPPPDAVPVASEPAGQQRGTPSAAGIALAEAAGQLAQVVSDRWQREEEQRRIHDPFPLPVRWRPVAAELTDHWDNIRRIPAGATSGPLDLAGDLAAIADTYQRIPSGRLVVLGRAGSGKTVLTSRFALDYLRTRTSADPVPVIFSLGSWDPTTTALRDWLTDQLLRDYPGLAARAPARSTLAAALVGADLILPVLDGFDEIADGLHGPALEALNASSLPLLLTSRPGEYARAVAATDVLTRAAGVELTDLTPADLVNYLPRSTRPNAPGNGSTSSGTTGTVWDPVLNELSAHPERPACATLAAVLSTPLMVVLARTVYSDTLDPDPAALLDTHRFPSSQALEEHLLGSFVRTVYRHQPHHHRKWDPEDVQRWLGYLARHLDRRGTYDLAWWQLGDSLRRSSRILIVVLTAALATAGSDWLVSLPLDLTRYGGSFGLGAGLLDGVLVGSLVGLAFGLVYGLMVGYGGVRFEPARVRVRLPGRGGRTGGGLVRRFAGRFGGGLLGGFAVGLGYGPVTAVARGLFYGFAADLGVVVKVALINTLVTGTVFGLAAGSTFGLTAVLEAPLDLSAATSPTGLLVTNRTTVVRQALMLGVLLMVAIIFGGQLVVDLLQGTLGPLVWGMPDSLVIGAVGGLGGGLSYAFAFTAWGQWVVLSRIWLPLTGRLPWATVAFLDDAYRRGVLRQAGAVYQFRHARLQDHLSRTFAARGDDRS
ncbi:helix-turn-helix domain-containing protein [Fodinicola feengrottensis]|uniref:helix-turn-helix domain-containing protein n=1 Tax=Fodinicola feengrottensis TaxID=435914 RepID=UPI0031DBA510